MARLSWPIMVIAIQARKPPFTVVHLESASVQAHGLFTTSDSLPGVLYGTLRCLTCGGRPSQRIPKRETG